MNKQTWIVVVFISVIAACKKEPIKNNNQHVGRSRITYYANITINGDGVMSLVQGETFTDPGASAKAGGIDLPVNISGSVNSNTVGLYVITYSAVNADGYSSSASRIVVVLPEADRGTDVFTGSYVAVPVGTTPGPASISKAAPGVYYSTNVWGNSGAVIPGYFISTDGNTIIVPRQDSPFGLMETTTAGSFDAGLITWTLDLIDQGNLIRTKKWQKQ